VFSAGRCASGRSRSSTATPITTGHARQSRAAFTPARHVAGIHSTHSIRHNITHALRNRYGISHFITDADAGAEVLLREDGIPPGKVTTVPSGSNRYPDDMRAGFRARIRGSMGIDEGTVVIGNVARLVPFKGHRHLLDAAAIVAHEKRGVLFLIAGDGNSRVT